VEQKAKEEAAKLAQQPIVESAEDRAAREAAEREAVMRAQKETEAEALRRCEEERLLEEKQREEARLEEEARLAAEAQAEEDARLAEEARRAEEENRAKVARLAEEARLRAAEEEARRQAEIAQQLAAKEAARMAALEEQRLKRAVELRRQEELRFAAEAECVAEEKRQREVCLAREKATRAVAARQVQALLRGRLGRKHSGERAVEVSREEEEAKKREAAEAKKKAAVEAALKQQRAAYERRRLAAEAKAEAQRVKEREAVSTLQRLFRGKEGRKEAEAYKLERKLRARASRNMANQARLRARQAKKEEEVQEEEEEEEPQQRREYPCQVAAVKLQSLYRGWRARRQQHSSAATAVNTSMDEFEYPAILEEAVVEFRHGQEIPARENQALLKQLANVLRQQQHIKVCIYGHAKQGENPALAGRRSDSVRGALIQAGVLRNQLRSMVGEASGPGREGHSWATFSIIQEIKLKTPISFEAGSTTLSAPAKTALLHVARVLAEHPHLSLRVEGHTDLDETKIPFTVPAGLLSEERAVAALRELEAVGVAHRRLELCGRAAECPVGTNLTQFGRSQNRRIELHLVDVMKESMVGEMTPTKLGAGTEAAPHQPTTGQHVPREPAPLRREKKSKRHSAGLSATTSRSSGVLGVAQGGPKGSAPRVNSGMGGKIGGKAAATIGSTAGGSGRSSFPRLAAGGATRNPPRGVNVRAGSASRSRGAKLQPGRLRAAS